MMLCPSLSHLAPQTGRHNSGFVCTKNKIYKKMSQYDKIEEEGARLSPI